ncbi:molybdenum ABC transporter ATP-binding protein [Palleronia sp. LCG004]|uniref:molybdenum ABC transporter ATP-binding protein n=1 Tax=Palleronia sp. LCG004 TaxID=3079304 RepID=UPI00294399ED|nr:molybdenum ABC transporter ATP-binding protein [Palleronia sp. LCG004]WOI56272.1 molybdenum ABC transporter ATP-binding protein [Palleronia sp. LCG004]
MLEIRLRHAFSDFTLDVDFASGPGVTVLFGRSGSGKTTIAQALAGLLTPDEGRIAIGGETLLDTAKGIRLAPHRRRIGYVFQEARLFPHLTVSQNLRFGAWFAPKNAPREEMGRVVEMLGIGHLLTRRPGALSGGEKSRVSLGRALLSAPRVILADEPLAALDDARKAEILPYFERLRDEARVPILYVSHSASEVARLATTVVALRDGRVIEHGTPGEVLSNPGVLPNGPREVGSIVRARIVAHHDDGLTELDASGIALFLPRVDHPTGTWLRVRIAAHDVILSRHRLSGISALNVFEGRVEEIRIGDGPGALVVLVTAAGRILARITQRSVRALDLAPGIVAHAAVKSVAVASADIGFDGRG